MGFMEKDELIPYNHWLNNDSIDKFKEKFLKNLSANINEFQNETHSIITGIRIGFIDVSTMGSRPKFDSVIEEMEISQVDDGGNLWKTNIKLG